jgi:hypothetical protein
LAVVLVVAILFTDLFQATLAYPSWPYYPFYFPIYKNIPVLPFLVEVNIEATKDKI